MPKIMKDIVEPKYPGGDSVVRADLAKALGPYVVDGVDLPGGFRIMPPRFEKGYYPHWGVLANPATQEAFLLTDRTFGGANGVPGVDYFFRHTPSLIINRLQRMSSDGAIRILEVGGGRDSLAAREVARKFPNAEVINTDIVAPNVQEGNFVAKNGSIDQLPIADDSIDLVYSHQVIPFLSGRDDRERPKNAVQEIVRVLRPGGVGLIDDGHFSKPEDGGTRERLESQLGVLLVPRWKSYGDRFLVILKEPADLEVIKITEYAARAA
jgi:SAM-dependent methyltransferase